MTARDAIECLRQEGLDHEADVAADALFEAEADGETISWICDGDPSWHLLRERPDGDACPYCGAAVHEFGS